MEKICCALAWSVKKLRQYMLCHTTWLITKIDPIKYIFEKLSLLRRVARWQVQLSKYNIQYVSQKAIKGSTIADFLVERASEDYECRHHILSGSCILFRVQGSSLFVHVHTVQCPSLGLLIIWVYDIALYYIVLFYYVMYIFMLCYLIYYDVMLLLVFV